MSPPHLPIYLAQISPLSPVPNQQPSDSPLLFPTIQLNLASIRVHLTEAAAKLPDGGVVVFPEYGAQGILQGFPCHALAAPFLLKALKELSKELGLAIVITLVEPLEEQQLDHLRSPFALAERATHLPPPLDASERQKWFEEMQKAKEIDIAMANVAYYIDDGKVQATYHKRNLWHPERDYLQPGPHHSSVFETRWGKAGMLICWDLSNPDAAAELVKQGATIIFAPTFWLSTDSDPIQLAHRSSPSEPAYDTALLPALCLVRSFETETILVLCNAGSVVPSPSVLAHTYLAIPPRLINEAVSANTLEKGYFGASAVYAPLIGRVLSDGYGDKECGMVVRVPMKAVEDGRKLYQIGEDSKRRG